MKSKQGLNLDQEKRHKQINVIERQTWKGCHAGSVVNDLISHHCRQGFDPQRRLLRWTTGTLNSHRRIIRMTETKNLQDEK